MIHDGDEMTVSFPPAGLPCGRQEGRLPKVTWKIGGIARSRLGGPWSPLHRAASELPGQRPLLWGPPVTLCSLDAKLGISALDYLGAWRKWAGMVSMLI